MGSEVSSKDIRHRQGDGFLAVVKGGARGACTGAQVALVTFKWQHGGWRVAPRQKSLLSQRSWGTSKRAKDKNQGWLWEEEVKPGQRERQVQLSIKLLNNCPRTVHFPLIMLRASFVPSSRCTAPPPPTLKTENHLSADGRSIISSVLKVA